VKLLYHNITKKADVADLADHEGIMVYVDRGRISQVISNLIGRLEIRKNTLMQSLLPYPLPSRVRSALP
jgi:hypothetical protein